MTPLNPIDPPAPRARPRRFPVVATLVQRFLQPGELIVTREACEITTVLGPCVAVVMWLGDPRFAAMCHGMMPKPPVNLPTVRDPDQPWKFTNEVIPAMVHRVERLGVRPTDITVKIFGGANLINADASGGEDASIGSRNVSTALTLLDQAGFLITAIDVRGGSGRKVIFNTATGGVRVKRIVSTHD